MLVPSSTFTSEKDFKDFVKNLEDQRNEFGQKIEKDEQKNLELTISRISNQGEVRIRFEEELQLPEDFDQLVWDSHGKENAILEIFMVEPDNYSSMKLKSFSIESFIGTELVV